MANLGLTSVEQKGRYHPGRDAVSARARDARLWLKARPESEIVVVAHGGLMHFLTGEWEDCSKNEGTDTMRKRDSSRLTHSSSNRLGQCGVSHI